MFTFRKINVSLVCNIVLVSGVQPTNLILYILQNDHHDKSSKQQSLCASRFSHG